MRTNKESTITMVFLMMISSLAGSLSWGQTIHKTGNEVIDHEVQEGSTVILEIQEYRGTLQWQKSTDGTSWLDWEGETDAVIEFTANEGQFVRVAVTSENCNPLFSETVHVIVTAEPEGTFIDARDSREYRWVLIGSQKWMAENVAWLPAVSPPTEGSATEKHFYVKGYEGSDLAEARTTDNYAVYGALYNWPAAMEACPEGWHLPSDIEWKILETYLGMSEFDINDQGWRLSGSAGGKLKEAGTEHWIEPNAEADNSSGFTALPGDARCPDGFCNIGYAEFFCSSERGENIVGRDLAFINGGVGRWIVPIRDVGSSVRCLRNPSIPNTPPTASFTWDPSEGTADTRFLFDASACTDTETAADFLEVRWDFDGDGTWDSEFDQVKFIPHQFTTPGTYTVKLEVIDERELSDTFTKTITIN